MANDTAKDRVWNVLLTNYEEWEYHQLSLEELRQILDEEWDRQFNGIFIGRDVDCVGRLMVFFYHDKAYVAYEDFQRQEWRYSYDLKACDTQDWDELVRLTPDDTEEYSFRKCSIVPKERAMHIVDRYLDSGQLEDLYLPAVDGKPSISTGEP